MDGIISIFTDNERDLGVQQLAQGHQLALRCTCLQEPSMLHPIFATVQAIFRFRRQVRSIVRCPIFRILQQASTIF